MIMNSKKSIPKTLDRCKCLCCTDCGYYDVNISWLNCPHRNELIRKHYNKAGTLGV